MTRRAIYRSSQAPLNAIWEGSGNVICLDVLRALRVEPEAVHAFLQELSLSRGKEARYDAMLGDLTSELHAGAADPSSLESRARLLVDKMAVMLQASCLLQHGQPDVARAYCASRLPAEGQLPGANYGARSVDLAAAQDVLIDRVMVFN